MRQTRPGFLKTLQREISSIASRPLYPLLLIVLPLIGFGILLAIFYEEKPRDLPIAVLDEDHTALSRKIARMLDAAETMTIKANVNDLGDGEQALLNGSVYAIVVLPEGLEREVKRRSAPDIVLMYNAQWVLPGSMINRDVRKVVAAVSGGIDCQMRRAAGESSAAASAHLEPVVADARALYNPQLNYVFFLVIALLPTLLQIFILLAAVQTMGGELKNGTAAQWIESAGGSLGKAVAGKLLPYTANYFVMGLFMIALFFYYFGVPMRGNLALVIVAMLLFVAAYQALALALVAWSANLRLATSLASFYSGPAFAFTGVTFPLIAMPFIAKLWGAFLPLTHFLKLVNQQAVVGAPVSVSLMSLLGLMTFVVMAPLLSLKRLSVVARDPSYWGRR